jgi:hypothetical protein
LPKGWWKIIYIEKCTWQINWNDAIIESALRLNGAIRWCNVVCNTHIRINTTKHEIKPLDEGLNALSGKNPSGCWLVQPTNQKSDISAYALVNPFTSVCKYWQNKHGEWLCTCLCIFRKQIHLYSHNYDLMQRLAGE